MPKGRGNTIKDKVKKQKIGIVIKQDILENQVNKVYLSLGTNLGKKKTNLELAKFLLNSSGINVIKTSSFYRSKSWPNENFPEYLNIILLANTKLRLIELLDRKSVV